jgi:hypothetical protein
MMQVMRALISKRPGIWVKRLAPGGNGAVAIPANLGNGSPAAVHIWRAQLVDVPYAARLLGVGARAQLAPGTRLDARSSRALVELSLFAEGTRGRWETEVLDWGAPFVVDVDDLEESVRHIVMPDRLATLAGMLRGNGLDLEAGDLEVLPFMLEVDRGLETEMVKRRVGHLSAVAR